MKRTENLHIFYLDVLRLVAIFGVVFIHTAGGMLVLDNISLNTIYILKIYQNLCRYCVPIFIMISGFLFLNSSKPFKKILSKNVVRIFTAFIFWAVVYNILLYFTNKKIVLFYFHLWYLPMIAGLYLLVPFFRVFVKEQKLLIYFLVLWGGGLFVYQQF